MLSKTVSAFYCTLEPGIDQRICHSMFTAGELLGVAKSVTTPNRWVLCRAHLPASLQSAFLLQEKHKWTQLPSFSRQRMPVSKKFYSAFASAWGRCICYRKKCTNMASSARTFVEVADRAAVPGLRDTVWNQADQEVLYPKLEKDMSADVVVVGAGLSGLSVAFNMAKEGKSVIVLEGRVVGAGQTGRTTAHITSWFDDYYYTIEKLHGHFKTQLIADSYQKAIDFIEKTVNEEGIDCEFARVDGYLYPHEDTKDAYDKIQTEFDTCQKLGLDVQMVDLGKDPSNGSITTAVRFPNSAQFHPLKYLNGLAKVIDSKGGKIFEQTKVQSFHNNQVTTSEGIIVTAGAVVMATNTPLHRDQLIHSFQQAEHFYAVGLKVPKGSVKSALWWDTATPYHKVRIEPKEDYDVLIVGGGDHNTGMRPENFRDAYGILETWARARWTTAGEVVCKWTGQAFKPVDFLHYIGPDPLAGTIDLIGLDQYIVTGDSGQGIMASTIAGILIKDLILGNENPWAEVYTPKRGFTPSKATAAGMGTRAWNTVQGIKDLFPMSGVDSIDIEDMAPCSGSTVQEGLNKMAVYKDDKGALHKYSAICPHLGCVVKWNPLDGTFDCPCHGSIFDHHGRCINGPANADLSVLD